MTARAAPPALWESRLLGIVAATLVVFGVAAVYSASSIWAVQNDAPGGTFAWRQLLGAVVGMALLVLGARIDYHVWRRHAWTMLGVVAVLLLIPLLPFTYGIAPELNGARRWVGVGGARFQPSEFAKFAVVAWTAMLAAKKGDQVREFRRGLAPFLVVLLPLAGLVVLEPDLSTATVILLLGGIVVFAAGARIGHFLILGVLALPVLWHEIATVQYRLARMVSFLSASEDVGDASWQISQSLIGIGAGRVVGTGFGEGLQKLGYLPYAYSDFIFSTIGEEWGFVGVTVIIGLFVLYAALGLRIARCAPDRFGLLLATGLTSMVLLAAILHVAVTLALVPTTGISLPFISYGRSGLLVSLFATGVIMSVARGSRAAARGGARGRG
jgi:cell division protein FtsW